MRVLMTRRAALVCCRIATQCFLRELQDDPTVAASLARHAQELSGLGAGVLDAENSFWLCCEVGHEVLVGCDGVLEMTTTMGKSISRVSGSGPDVTWMPLEVNYNSTAQLVCTTACPLLRHYDV